MSELTHNPRPDIVHKAADNREKQDRLASDAVGQGAVWNR